MSKEPNDAVCDASKASG